MTSLVSDQNSIKLRSVSKKPIYSLLHDCTCAKNFSEPVNLHALPISSEFLGNTEYFAALVFHFTPSSREEGMNDGIEHFALAERRAEMYNTFDG